MKESLNGKGVGERLVGQELERKDEKDLVNDSLDGKGVVGDCLGGKEL